MKRKIYELLTPRSIRENIYRANVRQFCEAEFDRLRSVEESLPRAELSSVYIENLRVFTNRNAFLNAMKKDAIVAEIGVRDGKFTDKILSIALPRTLHLIGAWPNEKDHDGLVERQIRLVENRFKAEIASGQIVINSGTLLAELEGLNDNYLDWVYVDTGFSYGDIATLLELCQKKMKSDGVIAGRNYITGSLLDRERYGVIEAVNGFCKKNGWEMVYLTNESHRNLSYAIQRTVR